MEGHIEATDEEKKKKQEAVLKALGLTDEDKHFVALVVVTPGEEGFNGECMLSANSNFKLNLAGLKSMSDLQERIVAETMGAGLKGMCSKAECECKKGE